MASAPSERPELFVCTDCQNVTAGTPSRPAGEEHPYDEWSAPDSCAACGAEELVALDDWGHQF